MGFSFTPICYNKAMEKPVLFLDFDRTLFDTTQLRAWLGADIESRINAVVLGTLELPRLASMLYPDTLPFLVQARKTHRLVLLTCTSTRIFQEKKVYSSGIAPHLDDILITESKEGNSGKGLAAKEYLYGEGGAGSGHFFVDDLLENISEVKTENPPVTCIQIERASPVPNGTFGRVLPREDSLFTPGLLPPDGKVTNLEELFMLLQRLSPPRDPMRYR